MELGWDRLCAQRLEHSVQRISALVADVVPFLEANAASQRVGWYVDNAYLGLSFELRALLLYALRHLGSKLQWSVAGWEAVPVVCRCDTDAP